MNAQQFMSLGETGERLELVDGVVVLSPSPGFAHQRVARLVLQQLLSSAGAASGVEVLYKIDVVFAPGLVYCPDIVVYKPGKLNTTTDRLELPPDLVVELLSPTSRVKDLSTKRDDYEKYGVGEYWAVDPADASVRVFRRSGAEFIEEPAAVRAVECASVAGVRVDFTLVRAAINNL